MCSFMVKLDAKYNQVCRQKLKCDAFILEDILDVKYMFFSKNGPQIAKVYVY